jgi:two-component system chemotaxis response regulator CheB
MSSNPSMARSGATGQDGIKVLVVDDSAIVRKILAETLLACPDIHSVNTAPDAYVARNKILLEPPDVVTLDLEMPGMDGMTFLKKLMRYHPVPVIVISSLARDGCQLSVEALRLGAVEVLPKPGGPYSTADLKRDLLAKVRAAAEARLESGSPERSGTPCGPLTVSHSSTVIAIAASTGGVQAVEEVLKSLPENCPGIVIAQHIPAGFSAALARRLDQLCRIRVREAVDGDLVGLGQALIAPGNRHLLLNQTSSGYRVSLSDAPAVCFQRPSADVLFESVARAAGSEAIGIILTGMGSDGAEGLLQMRRCGAWTIAQSPETCVVFGMPKQAIQRGAVDHVLPLSSIGGVLQKSLGI